MTALTQKLVGIATVQLFRKTENWSELLDDRRQSKRSAGNELCFSNETPLRRRQLRLVHDSMVHRQTVHGEIQSNERCSDEW